ncbi:phage head morphogenesis protein [Cellulosimicrobium funkei]|nr:phage head morphogenesis protein [Cellulosimicrobium funkei]
MALTDKVLQILAASRDAIGELADQQVISLVGAWVDSWDGLANELESALDDLMAAADDGRVTASQVSRSQRLRAALAVAEGEAERLRQYAADNITADVPTVVQTAAETSRAVMAAQLPPAAQNLQEWVPLNENTLTAIVARTTQQIHASSLPLSGEMIGAMRRELVNGISVGDNPRTTGRKIMTRLEGNFNGGLSRATRIARTELLDAGRATSHASAQANQSMIEARVWVASLDSRTCTSCLAQHGTEWPVDQFGPEDHQQGRCTFVDKTKTWAELGFTGIEDDDRDLAAERDAWFENLTDETQRAVMGPARLELFKSGAIGWDDMTTRKDNPNWRPAHYETPVKDLTNR